MLVSKSQIAMIDSSFSFNRLGGVARILPSIKNFSRDFLLVCDWENPKRNSQDRVEHESSIMTYKYSQEHLKADLGDHLGESRRLWNDIAILDDLEEYETADSRLLRTRSRYLQSVKRSVCLGRFTNMVGYCYHSLRGKSTKIHLAATRSSRSGYKRWEV
jgi:hypothetical protein